jgi:GT2 family glycosyltransferase
VNSTQMTRVARNRRPKVDLSFVILTWNSARYVERCFASIDAALAQSRLFYEVLVLDNGSKDKTAQLLARLSQQSNGRIVPFYEQTNIGTTRSRNRLFAAARGDYLCVMDSDVELGSGVVDTLVPLLERDGGLGIVAPRIRYPSGKWQKSYDRFPTLVDKINRFFRLTAIEEREALKMTSAVKPFVVDYVISAFWLMRRELLQTVGLLDERIFYAPEDVDFCLRVWKSGFRILYVPTVSVTHHAQELSRGWNLNKAKLAHAQGLAYYFMKHRYLIRRPDPAKDKGLVAHTVLP